MSLLITDALFIAAAYEGSAWFLCEPKSSAALSHFGFRGRLIYARKGHEAGKVVLFAPPYGIRYDIPDTEARQWLTLTKKLSPAESQKVEESFQWEVNR